MYVLISTYMYELCISEHDDF